MKIDYAYAHDYENRWSQFQSDHARLKPIMIVVGAAMVVAGAYTCFASLGTFSFVGVPTMLFGADMITSSIWGYSILDNSLKALLYGWTAVRGDDASFILEEGFSFFQFTSDHLKNLVLTQLTFMIVGGGLTGFQGIADAFAQGVKNLENIAEYSSWSLMKRISYFSEVTLRYQIEQLSHLVGGMVFLFVLGAAESSVGPALGVSSYWTELVFQSVMLASIVFGTTSQITGRWAGISGSESELNLREYAYERVPLNLRLTWSKLRTVYSALGTVPGTLNRARVYYGMTAIALSLQLASQLLQIAYVGASVVV